ncbi:hypothetical protein ACRSLK_12440 [Halopseudomonas pachastrellae]|uniref:hypothetical protein n=1 Tax=Halopseudomonas pachastrellae TaxID=254161 RepID=UPI003D7C58C2
MIAEAQFNRATLDCMTALRRQLKRSLGVTVRLGDPDAVEHMIGLSRDSSELEIRELGSRLAGLVNAPEPAAQPSPLAQGAIAARQFQHRQENMARLEADTDQGHAPSGSVRIYRGQVIRG